MVHEQKNPSLCISKKKTPFVVCGQEVHNHHFTAFTPPTEIKNPVFQKGEKKKGQRDAGDGSSAERGGDIDTGSLAAHVLGCISNGDRLGALSLGAQNATLHAVKQAYRTYSKILHPDKTHGDKRCADAFIALKRCRDELSTEGELEKEIAKRSGNGIVGSNSKLRDILLSGGFHRPHMTFADMQRNGSRPQRSTPAYTSSGSFCCSPTASASPYSSSDVFGDGHGSYIQRSGPAPSSTQPTPRFEKKVGEGGGAASRQQTQKKPTVQRSRRMPATSTTRKQHQQARKRSNGVANSSRAGIAKRQVPAKASTVPPCRRRNGRSPGGARQVDGMHTFGVSVQNPLNAAWTSLGTRSLPGGGQQQRRIDGYMVGYGGGKDDGGMMWGTETTVTSSFVNVDPQWNRMLSDATSSRRENVIKVVS
jgi:curved DNA-binding protein CbpA